MRSILKVRVTRFWVGEICWLVGMIAVLVGCGGGGGPAREEQPVPPGEVDFGSFTNDLTVSPTRGALTGRVVDKNATPVSEAIVMIDNPQRQAGPESFSVRTDMEGTYRIGNVVPVFYRLQATKPGMGGAILESVLVEANKVTTLPQMQLGFGRFVGRVTDKDTGQPIGRATVTLQKRQQALTNPDGTYSIGNLLPGRYLLTAAKVGYAPDFREGKVEANRETRLDFVLQRVAPPLRP